MLASKLKVTFFGDSICFGQFVSIHKIWIVELSRRLEERFKDQPFPVTNSAINGNTTRQALERMAYDIQIQGVDLLYVQFGMNDGVFWQTDRGANRVSKSAFRANLLEIIDRGRKFGAKEVLLATNHPTTRETAIDYAGISFQESNAQYSEIVRQVASESSVTLVDIEKVWRDFYKGDQNILASLILSDGAHLSEEGHQLYSKSVWPYLEKATAACLGE